MGKSKGQNYEVRRKGYEYVTKLSKKKVLFGGVVGGGRVWRGGIKAGIHDLARSSSKYQNPTRQDLKNIKSAFNCLSSLRLIMRDF